MCVFLPQVQFIKSSNTWIPTVVLNGVSLNWMGGPKCGATDQVEAGDRGGEKIYLKQNKGDRNLPNAPWGSCRHYKSEEAVCNEAAGRGYFQSWGGMVMWSSLTFLVTVSSCK